jgi:hypothetical protein
MNTRNCERLSVAQSVISAGVTDLWKSDGRHLAEKFGSDIKPGHAAQTYQTSTSILQFFDNNKVLKKYANKKTEEICYLER